ncbi:MAG: type II CAAX endopeptidase family protein [Oscillospiraceae bacterium]|nr:type II CAAX endopeptidase family protein [Oscillospiraceae bacterium]
MPTIPSDHPPVMPPPAQPYGPVQQPYVPLPPNPAYVAEKRSLRQSANYFGVAAILYFVVNIAASLFFGFLIQLVYRFTGRHLFGNSEVSYYLLNMGVYMLSFFVSFGAYLLFLKMPWKAAVPFRPVRIEKVLLSIPATFAFSVVGSILTSILALLFSITGYQPVTSDIQLPVTVPGTVLYFVLLAVLPPVFEEIAFRGILMQSLRRFGDGFALLISAIIFGLFHLNMVQAPYAFLLGLWFGYLVLRTGSLRISMALHACVNLSAGVMSFLMEGMTEQTLVIVNLIYIVFWILTGVASFLFLILRTRGPLGLYPARTLMRTGQKMGTYFSSVAMILALLAILYFMIQNFERVA